MEFKEELKRLEEIKVESLNQQKKVEKELENAVAQAIKGVHKEYEHKILSSEQKLIYDLSNLESYCRMIVKFSSFSISDIKEILAEIVSVYEGRNYRYSSVVGGRDSRQLEVIIDETVSQNDIYLYATNSYFKDQKNKRKMFVLYDGNVVVTQYPFYQLREDGLGIVPAIKDGEKLNYIYEFIDKVISYKMENEIENITVGELEVIKHQFLLCKREEIEAIYQKRDEEEEARMQEELMAQKSARQYQFQKVFGKK